ncbi:conserved hypothetical protein [Cyanobium sp. PCC 7001]|nr:conserved hypothetical protein [Cyanobium sp. PCC 7001]
MPFEAGGPAVTIDGQLTLAAAMPGEGAPVLELALLVRDRDPGDGAGNGVASLAIPELLPDAPTAGAEGLRRDGLWQHTCLECFVGPAGQPHYLEFNLAPHGAWTVYALDGYRQGLRPAPDYRSLPFRCTSSPEGLELNLRCALPRGWKAVACLDWQVSAVLEDRHGSLSYWALRHPRGAADFHDRNQWVLDQPL